MEHDGESKKLWETKEILKENHGNYMIEPKNVGKYYDNSWAMIFKGIFMNFISMLQWLVHAHSVVIKNG